MDGLVEYNYNGHILASDFNNLSTNQDKEIDIYYLSNNGRQYHRDIYIYYNVLDVFDTNWAFNNVGNLNNINELSSFSRMI